MAKSVHSSVPVGYRIAGLLFGTVGVLILALTWYVRESGWILVSLLVLLGLQLLLPLLCMLVAHNDQTAKRAAAWLLLDLIRAY